MKIENDIIVYQKFNIIDKHNHCSLAEYITIYGEKKIAIILNNANQIIQDINNKYPIENQNELLNIREIKKVFKKIKKNKLKGDFVINNREYFINFPYSIYHLGKRIFIDEPSRNIVESIRAIRGSTFANRIDAFNHKIIEINNEKLIFYDLDKISKLIEDGSKILNTKQKYKKDTYIVSMLNKDKFKEFKESKIENIINSQDNQEKEYLTNNIKISPLKNDELTFHYDFTPQSNVPNVPIIQPHIKIDEDITKNDTDSEVIKYKSSIQNNQIINKGNLEPDKKLRSFLATNRNISIVKYLKNLYKDKCQICGETIEISYDCFLSEVHHIKPLGVHNGPDVVENAVVLCPNHHAMFDRGTITIDIDKKIVIHFNPGNPLNNKRIELRHEINRNYMDYHFMNIFINSTEHKSHLEMASGMDTTIQIVDFGNIVTLQDMDTSELFDIKLEDKFNKDFMKPIEKELIGKYLNDIIRHDNFKYKVIKILIQ
ncbi:MAG: HNH endonuclease [Desulfitobacteriaceae bacterium]